MTDWKERAERAEAELARLRAQEPEYWQWRRKRDPWEIGKTFNSQVYATTADSEVRCLYAAPPAQPAEPTIDEQVASVNAAFDAWRNGEDATLTLGLAAQPAEPVQRLSDAGIEALAGKHGTTYRNRHFPTQPAFSFSNGSLHRFVRDIESAIQPQPGWRDVESAPKDGTHVLLWCQTHIQKGVQAMPFTGRWFSGGPWIIVNADMAIQRVEPTHWMALPPAPKATP